MSWTISATSINSQMSFSGSGSGHTSVAYGGAVAIGDLLLLTFFFTPSGGDDVTNVTDDQGNIWQQIQTSQNRGNGEFVSFWWAISTTAATPTLDVETGSGSGSYSGGAWEVVSFTPPAGTISLEDSSIGTAVSNTVTADVTTTGTDDLVIAACLGNAYTGGVATGYTLTSPAGSSVGMAYANKTSPGTYSPGITGTAAPLCAIGAAFKTTGGGGGGGGSARSYAFVI